ncbi:MAG: hypothetical protein U5R48_16775 [Gammaproteobacteria bacterium]|nr:hypothetical protein [Gammaproteobacteria bacterium]
MGLLPEVPGLGHRPAHPSRGHRCSAGLPLALGRPAPDPRRRPVGGSHPAGTRGFRGVALLMVDARRIGQLLERPGLERLVERLRRNLETGAAR